jgi:hypothetical protein
MELSQYIGKIVRSGSVTGIVTELCTYNGHTEADEYLTIRRDASRYCRHTSEVLVLPPELYLLQGGDPALVMMAERYDPN